MGMRAAGRRLDRSCDSDGIRLAMDSLLCGSCGKRDARATGRKAARNDREGTADMAAMTDECNGSVYAAGSSSMCCTLHRNISSFGIAKSITRYGREIVWARSDWLPLSREGAFDPGCTFSNSTLVA